MPPPSQYGNSSLFRETARGKQKNVLSQSSQSPGQNGTEVKGILSGLLPSLSRYSQGSGDPVFSPSVSGVEKHTGFCCLWISQNEWWAHNPIPLSPRWKKRVHLCQGFQFLMLFLLTFSPNRKKRQVHTPKELAAWGGGKSGRPTVSREPGPVFDVLSLYSGFTGVAGEEKERRATGYPRKKPT